MIGYHPKLIYNWLKCQYIFIKTCLFAYHWRVFVFFVFMQYDDFFFLLQWWLRMVLLVCWCKLVMVLLHGITFNTKPSMSTLSEL